MARTRQLRMYVDDCGILSIVDPGLDTLELMQSIQPGFILKEQPLKYFSAPSLIKCKKTGAGVDLDALELLPEKSLWELHLKRMCSWEEDSRAAKPGEATILDLKKELVWRMLSQCRLCARCCNVDRTRGERGLCGLGEQAFVAEHFVHIAEEPPVNPSLLVSLRGCGLKCRFCQQPDLLDPAFCHETDCLADLDLWKNLELKGARSLSFIGGNPDESLYAILNFLADAPDSFNLPIVWNCNAYSSLEVVSILDKVADVFMPDFKFYSAGCSSALADAPDYPSVARQVIKAMLETGTQVIVRVLVLPGHGDCCHAPALEWLSKRLNDNLTISIRGQYFPNHLISDLDGHMAGKTSLPEIKRLVDMARYLGLETY